jgi:hypothetical protein
MLDSDDPDPPPVAVMVVRPDPEIEELPPLKLAGLWFAALEADEAPPPPTTIVLVIAEGLLILEVRKPPAPPPPEPALPPAAPPAPPPATIKYRSEDMPDGIFHVEFPVKVTMQSLPIRTTETLFGVPTT